MDDDFKELQKMVYDLAKGQAVLQGTVTTLSATVHDLVRVQEKQQEASARQDERLKFLIKVGAPVGITIISAITAAIINLVLK